MTSTRLWDRAAAPPARADGRRRPQVATLATGEPSIEELFDFMRDAESRFATLRLRIEERTITGRGEELVVVDVALRHPGAAKVTTTRPGPGPIGDYEVWASDGELVRTYSGIHRIGTERPVRNRPRGLDDRDLPGTAKVYEAITPLPAETLPETFVHPAGYCQNVLATGNCGVTGADIIRGREAVLLTCLHPRAIELPADRPDFRIDLAVDRETGIIVRLTESMAGQVTRDALVTDLQPDAALPASVLEFAFPSNATMLY
jgi:outer membrane lipoprotein-sorting protein